MNTGTTKRLAIVGDWAKVQWWMDRYIKTRIGADDGVYTQWLFSDFLAWAQGQQLTIAEPTTKETTTNEHS